MMSTVYYSYINSIVDTTKKNLRGAICTTCTGSNAPKVCEYPPDACNDVRRE